MHTRWPLFVALVAGVSAVALLWFVVLSNPGGEAVPASGGHYTEGVTRAPERMNPLFSGGNPVDADVAALIFSGLVRLGADGTPQPDLAERWEITGNGQSYVFHLRRGVAWQDGEPFSADDVVFTFKAIADTAFKGDSALAQLMQGVAVTARDAYTVEFKLEQAYAPFLAYMTVGVLPEHLLHDLDANQLFNAEFNARPVGTGPYEFRRHTGSGIELTTNDTYYLGPPHVSTFEFRVYADAAALSEALRAHEVDGALLGPETSASELEVIAQDGRLAMRQLASGSYSTVYLDTQLPVFADNAVRLALWRAINPQALIDDAVNGHGRPADTGIPHGSWAYTPVDVPSFDPGAAASSLEAAGWSRGSDGVRRNGDTRLEFTLSTTNDAARVAVAANLAQQWKAIGADVAVEPLASDAFIEEHLLPRKFQAALVAVDPGPDPDPYPFWHSTQVAPPGRNLSNYSNPQIDDVLERARQTTDTARRKELYAQFESFLVAAAPQVPLYSPVYTYVQSTRVRGFDGTLLAAPSSRFASVGAWYIKTRREG